MTAERRWARVALDAAPAVLALALSPVEAAVSPGPERPLARMRRLIKLERRLGLFFEPTVHAWFGARPPLMRTLKLAYVVGHLPVALGVLAWTRRSHPQTFALARDTFAATQALGVIGHIVAPTAPPRMVAGLGYDNRPGPGDHGLGRLVQSPYAAMPSAHTAFSVVAAGTVWTLARSRPVRAAALLYPPVVVTEIIATGDHIWLDSLAGMLVAGLGFAIARSRPRAPRRPRVNARQRRPDR